MELYFIRHAQSTNNALWLATGSSDGRTDDPELSDIGKRQAVELAKYLSLPAVSQNGSKPSRHGLTHLYSSPMVRAVGTGWPVAQALQLPLTVWKDLHEGGGIFLEEADGELVGRSGKGRAYFETSFPGIQLSEEIGEHGWWNKPYESEAERLVRARRVLDQLLTTHGGTEDRVAFFSHGDFYHRFLCVLFGIPAENSLWFSSYNTAISRIDFLQDEINIRFLNRYEFQPEDLQTR